MQSHTHKAIKTYGLFVHDERDTRSIHSTNEDQCRAAIANVRRVLIRTAK